MRITSAMLIILVVIGMCLLLIPIIGMLIGVLKQLLGSVIG